MLRFRRPYVAYAATCSLLMNLILLHELQRPGAFWWENIVFSFALFVLCCALFKMRHFSPQIPVVLLLALSALRYVHCKPRTESIGKLLQNSQEGAPVHIRQEDGRARASSQNGPHRPTLALVSHEVEDASLFFWRLNTRTHFYIA